MIFWLLEGVCGGIYLSIVRRCSHFVRLATWSQPSGVLRMKPTRDRQGTECRTRAGLGLVLRSAFVTDHLMTFVVPRDPLIRVAGSRLPSGSVEREKRKRSLRLSGQAS